MARQAFLFLQGCTSPFFSRLGDRLQERGHRIAHINFNVGDKLFWGRRPAWDFRHEAEAFPAFLSDMLERHGFTDIIMLGDTRPLHRPVPALATRLGVRVHVFEEGYFRPNWLTLERGGINGYSRLPRDPAWYRRTASRLSDPGAGEAVANPVWLLAYYEILYHLPNLANFALFPGYRTHRPYISGMEFAGWINRFARFPYYRRRDRARMEALIGRHAFYLVPLQLDSDAQVQVHSPFSGMVEMIDTVMHSFAQHAPGGTHLVFKNHPLDTGLTPYGRHIAARAREYGLEGRIHYLETGSFPALAQYALGTITLNSTAGIQALAQGCPTLCLGQAIYDLEGLTFQGELNDFWHGHTPPDRKLFHDFRKVVIHTTQINGGFYTRDGMALAVENSLPALESQLSPLERLL